MTVSGRELDLLKLNKVADRNRQELSEINARIDEQKEKSITSGDDVVKVANLKAREIIKDAEGIKVHARKISAELAEQLVKAEDLTKRSLDAQASNDERGEIV